MNRFASQYGFIVAAMAFAFGEGNAAVAYDEENNAATLSSEQLGAINKHMGEQSAQIAAGKESLEALGSQHATEMAAKDATIADLQAKLTAKDAEIATLQGKTIAAGATTTGEGADPNQEEQQDWVDMDAEHNREAAKLLGRK